MSWPLDHAAQTSAHKALEAITLDVVDKGVKIAAVLIGGIWTYLNYARGRTFRRRLEPCISGKISPGVSAGAWMVSGIAQVKNVGLSKVDIEKEPTAIMIDDLVLGATAKGTPKLLEQRIPGGVFDVFDLHRWIEPGETIEQSFAVPLPANPNRAGVKLRLRIVSRHKFFKSIEWNAD
jgi:hypothetical protein